MSGTLSSTPPRPTFGWPGWAHLRYAVGLSVLVGVWFGAVYGGCEWITAHRHWRVRLDLAWEQGIPLVPSMSLGYMSIYLMFMAAPFILRARSEFRAAAAGLGLAILCGGVGFLLFPSQAVYEPPHDLGMWKGLFEFADRLNLDYNMAPSLHVALSVGCAAALARRSARGWSVLWYSWAALVAASTLFTHQHHFVDVVSGWAVGWGALRAAWGRLEE